MCACQRVGDSDHLCLYVYADRTAESGRTVCINAACAAETGAEAARTCMRALTLSEC